MLVNPNRVGLQPVDGRDAVEERLDGGLLKEDAGLALHDGLQRAAPAEGEHGATRRLGLHRRDPEVLFPGQDEKPRARVTLATQIPPEKCKRINLGYRDPTTIRVEQFANREDEGILLVPKAGEMLYRLKNPPDWAKESL